MAITKVSSGLISADASSIDLNIDAGTLYLDVSENRVGIGTTSPSTKLHVYTTAGRDFKVDQGTANKTILSNDYGLTLKAGGGYNLDLDTGNASGTVRFLDNGSETMRIDSSGNLLVGKTSASIGTVGCELRNDGYILGANDGDAPLYLNRLSSDGDIAKFYKDGTTVGSIQSRAGLVSTIILDPRSGSLGTGITGSGASLSPTNGSGTEIDARNDIGTSTYRFKDLYLSNTIGNGAGEEITFNNAQDYLRFDTSGSERMRIDSSGNLLVGATSNINSSHTIYKEQSNNNIAVFENAGTSTPFGVQVRFTGEQTSRSDRYTYTSYHGSGSLALRFGVQTDGGIKNFSANNTNLSDRREKKNIEDADNTWSDVKQWSIRKYHYNIEEDESPKKVGVIAQEIEELDSNLVQSSFIDEQQNTERLYVKEQQMTWMAIKALQEAMIKIESLEARVTELES